MLNTIIKHFVSRQVSNHIFLRDVNLNNEPSIDFQFMLLKPLNIPADRTITSSHHQNIIHQIWSFNCKYISVLRRAAPLPPKITTFTYCLCILANPYFTPKFHRHSCGPPPKKNYNNNSGSAPVVHRILFW